MPTTPPGWVAQPREFEKHLEVFINALSLVVDFVTEQSYGLSNARRELLKMALANHAEDRRNFHEHELRDFSDQPRCSATAINDVNPDINGFLGELASATV